jgi:AraC family transcriptional regulator
VRLRPPKARETLSPVCVERVAEFVEARLDSPIRLSDLAGVSGASAFHFCRAFRNSTGESPYRFVVRRRIERARHLLSSTDSLEEAIARSCGFNSRASFCKAFTRVVGETPKRFRDRLRAGSKS